jgi:hypothetical protein
MVSPVSMIRCADCHATIPVPADLATRTMQCSYCGAVQAVPDLAAREQALLQHRRAELEEQRHRDEQARLREASIREAQREALERKERRSSIRWGRVTMLFSMLLAPVIISITVFDLPARLGFGDAGADRLALVATQLRERGCSELAPPSSLYAAGTVSRLVTLADGCLRVIAAGGPSHTGLTLRVFDLDGNELAKSQSSSDPQAEVCPAKSGSLRYEIVLGPAAKGRLTHQALRCPPPPAAPAPAVPGKPRRSAPR